MGRPWAACRSEALHYSIRYPARWHRDSNCAFFDPKPFTVPENSDFSGTALEVLVTQQSFDDLARSMVNPRFARLVSRREVEINGRRSLLLETVDTGQGLFERGRRFYSYLVDVSGRPPAIVQTSVPPRKPWGGRRAVADRAVRSLRILPGY